MGASAWFWTAAVSGVVCGALALVVVLAGWRRRIAEVAIVGSGLLCLSTLATAHGLSGMSLLPGASANKWSALLALPVGIAVTAPILASSSSPARWMLAHWRWWSTGCIASALALAGVLTTIDSEPPALVSGGLLVGAFVGGMALVRRQVWLYQVSKRPSSLVTAGAITGLTITSMCAMMVEPGSPSSWLHLTVENLGVLGAGGAIIIGYRTGRGVADILAPILSREPLAALEVGLAPEIHAFVAALDRKDRITRDHVVRTSALAMRVAIRAGLAPSRVRDIALGALLHDIGKLVVPSEILNKPTSLTDDEYATIKTHPEQGERLLASAPSLAGAAPFVRGHHERIDGRGYPDGLSGAQVRLDINLVSVADAWDAMTNTRQYRTGMAHERARQILRDGAGSQWGATAVEYLLAEIDANGPVVLAPLEGLGRTPEPFDAGSSCICEDAFEPPTTAPRVERVTAPAS